jgi:PAS domain S-box-containing protein
LSTGREVISFENRYRTKDGSYRWLLWKAVSLREKQLIYAAAHDITESKRFEQELRQTEERYQLVLTRISVFKFQN